MSNEVRSEERLLVVGRKTEQLFGSSLKGCELRSVRMPKMSFRRWPNGCRVAPAHVKQNKQLQPRDTNLGGDIYEWHDIKSLPEYAYLGICVRCGHFFVNGR